MPWKTTAILLVITIGVGAYISLYELRQPTPEERERLSKEIVSLPRESVTQLTLDLPQVKATLTHDGTAWRLTPASAEAQAPVPTRAYEELINGILRHTNPLRAERILTETPGQPLDLKTFGLEPPVGQMTLVASGTPTTLLIGEATAVGANRYLRVAGRPELFVVSSGLFDDANQPLEAFRDPMLIRFDTWSVDRLTVAAPAFRLALERSDNVWRLTEPLTDLADRAEVNKPLRRLAGLRIRRFVDDNPSGEDAAWGFDAPALEVQLVLHDKPAAPVTAVFGQRLADDASLIYARRRDEPSLYAVAADELEALRRDPTSLRATACFEFFTSLVSRVELSRDGSSWTIEQKEGTWREVGSEQTLETPKVEGFLGKLTELRLAGFEDDAPADLARYGLAPPQGALAVWTTDREAPQRLSIGSPIAGSSDRYGRIDGRDAVVRLPESVTDLLATSPDHLR